MPNQVLPTEEGAGGGVGARGAALPLGFPPQFQTPVSPIKTPTTQSGVGGCLSQFWEVWKDKGVSDWVVGVLRWGYSIEFHTWPHLSQEPMVQSANTFNRDLIGEQISTLLEKGALEEVLPPFGPGFYSRLFVVPKPDGRWRPIIDLSLLNDCVLIPRFKMESLQTIWSALFPGNFTVSIDLTDAYFHVPIRPSSRKYLRILFGNQVFQFRALPFGLSTAPWIFTKVMAEVKAIVHLQGVELYLYLDDWLCQIQSFCQGVRESEYLVSLCSDLGLMVNFKKSELIPSQDFVFIGARFNLLLNRVSPKEENVLKLLQKLRKFLRSQFQTAREFQSLLGSMSSQHLFIKYARLHMRPVQWHLQNNWQAAYQSPYVKIQVTPLIKTCLQWWINQCLDPQGVPLVGPEFKTQIFTDASLQGWGAHVGDALLQGLWSEEESRLHINVLEMRAVFLALKRFNPPQGQSILISSDNTTVVAHVNKQGGTHSWELMKETMSLFQLAIPRDWTLRARYIPGRLNVVADQLSRAGQILQSEWSLHQEIADWLFQMWSSPLIDLFATRRNKKTPIFVSPVPDSQALEVDALSMNFQGLDAYAYPPHQILLKVLQKFLDTTQCRLIVVAPWWPKQPWFPVINNLAVSSPVQLPQWKHMLKQPLSDVYHDDLEFLNLHAWFLVRNP